MLFLYIFLSFFLLVECSFRSPEIQLTAISMRLPDDSECEPISATVPNPSALDGFSRNVQATSLMATSVHVRIDTIKASDPAWTDADEERQGGPVSSSCL